MNQRRLMELRRMKYTDYLKTPEWKAKRELALERDNHRCRLCNTTEKLRVHHRSYLRLGDEPLDDLTTLCDDCHKNFHKQLRLVDHMATERRYAPPPPREEKSPEQKQKDDQQAWEDYLNGLLLQNVGLCLHVCAIVSLEDFAGEDTSALYRLLNTVSQTEQSLTEPIISIELQETANRAKLRAESKTPKEGAALVSEVVQCALRIKRMSLIRRNTKLKYEIQEAAEAGNKKLYRELLQQFLALRQQRQVMDAATHLAG